MTDRITMRADSGIYIPPPDPPAPPPPPDLYLYDNRNGYVYKFGISLSALTISFISYIYMPGTGDAPSAQMGIATGFNKLFVHKNDGNNYQGTIHRINPYTMEVEASASVNRECYLWRLTQQGDILMTKGEWDGNNYPTATDFYDKDTFVRRTSPNGVYLYSVFGPFAQVVHAPDSPGDTAVGVPCTTVNRARSRHTLVDLYNYSGSPSAFDVLNYDNSPLATDFARIGTTYYRAYTAVDENMVDMVTCPSVSGPAYPAPTPGWLEHWRFDTGRIKTMIPPPEVGTIGSDKPIILDGHIWLRAGSNIVRVKDYKTDGTVWEIFTPTGLFPNSAFIVSNYG